MTGTTTDVTTVTDTEVVVHRGAAVRRYTDLEPGRDHDLDGVTVRTLPSPSGPLRCRFATVNDVHFGEIEAGRIDDHPEGPIRRPEPGAEPYPEVMNRAAVEEIRTIDPAAVIVKGDLSLDGADEEWAAFEACYRPPFGDRLHVVAGNHDTYRHQPDYRGDHWIDLPGVTVALLDTTIPGATTGSLTNEQFDQLDERLAAATQPVFLMGHHQQWIGDPEGSRSDDYFGLHPDPSDRLDELCARHPAAVGYAAGHTHRHRRRTMRRSGIPSIEVGCTKDFPGTWAEYRVHDDAIVQIVHRMSSPAALAWSESCRDLYSDFGVDYASYALGSLEDRCFVVHLDRDRGAVTAARSG